MINETVLQDVLLAMVVHLKSFHVAVSSLIDKAAALRETMKGLDPTFQEVLQSKREGASSAEYLRLQLLMIDGLSLRLKDQLLV